MRRDSVERKEKQRKKSAVYAAAADGSVSPELAAAEHRAELRYLLGRVASVSLQGLVCLSVVCYAGGLVLWALEKDSQRSDRRSYKRVARAVARVENMLASEEVAALRALRRKRRERRDRWERREESRSRNSEEGEKKAKLKVRARVGTWRRGRVAVPLQEDGACGG